MGRRRFCSSQLRAARTSSCSPCPSSWRAFAEAGSAEVEAQDGQAEGLEGLHGVIDDFVVHGSSAERVRVAEEDGVFCLGRAGVEQGFETASGAGEVLDGSDSGGVHLLA